jgi:hypothetical protein
MLVGCGGSSSGGSAGNNGQAGNSGSAGSGGAAGNGGAAGSGAAGIAGAAGAAAQGGAAGQSATSYAVHFGPLQVAAMTEDTQCVVVRLGNATAIHVGGIHNQLGPASVQMILSAVTDTAEQTTPFECTPFASLFSQVGMTPLMITQAPDEQLAFPAGVGVALAANQMMRIELHYANLSPTDPATVQATSTLTTMPDADFQSGASFLAVEDTDISIPPDSSFTLGPVFFAFPAQYASATFFAVTSEEHHWGTSAQLWSASGATDPGTSLYLNTAWSMPPLTPLLPPVPGTAGTGLKLQCNWMSTVPATITAGQSANDELCLFVAYYYPSQGPSVCVHTDRVAGGLDVCCPGSSSCASLAN